MDSLVCLDGVRGRTVFFAVAPRHGSRFRRPHPRTGLCSFCGQGPRGLLGIPPELATGGACGDGFVLLIFRDDCGAKFWTNIHAAGWFCRLVQLHHRVAARRRNDVPPRNLRAPKVGDFYVSCNSLCIVTLLLVASPLVVFVRRTTRPCAGRSFGFTVCLRRRFFSRSALHKINLGRIAPALDQQFGHFELQRVALSVIETKAILPFQKRMPACRLRTSIVSILTGHATYRSPFLVLFLQVGFGLL